MKNNTTSKTTRTIKLDLEVEPEKTDEAPLIEIEIPEAPETLERPSLDNRKEAASKPLYLVRYE
jgi:hypothetical protein